MPTRISLYPRGAVLEWVSGQADRKKTPSEYACSGFSGGREWDPYMVIPISVLCCVALFPDKSMVPPYSASLHRLRHPVFKFVLFLVMFVFLFHDYCIIFAPLSLPSLASLVSSLPHQLDIEMLVWFFELCVVALFFSFLVLLFLAFRLVLSCRPSVGPSPTHIVRLIVPANSDLVPSGLGLRSASMHEVFVSFFFPFFCFVFFFPFMPLFALFCPSLCNSHF